MTTHIYVAPAGAGKTAHTLQRVWATAQDLQATPRVVVPDFLQVQSWHSRLAQEAGGVMGARVLTFDRLYSECLDAAGEVYTRLSEPVQYRLLRAVIDDLPLLHYKTLVDRPGFAQVLQSMVAELKAARVWPDDFRKAVTGLEGKPRLDELAHIYAAYQKQLQDQGWADRAGLGWLAVEALEQRAPEVGKGWPLLAVDGFDNFTPVQLALLKTLSGRVGEMLVTVTGSLEEERVRPVHRRFWNTQKTLEKGLGVNAQSLPNAVSIHDPVLSHLEAHLYESRSEAVAGQDVVDMVEAPDRAGEVRAALRWIKARLVEDALHPGQVALLARSITPYRPFLVQTAAEFGLPLRLVDGLPLDDNPAVAALLDLLRLMLPRMDGNPDPALPRRQVLEAWRSPYFYWQAQFDPAAPEPIGIADGDAELLDLVSRWGRVTGSLSQWEEVMEALRSLAEAQGEGHEQATVGLPRGAKAEILIAKFDRFVQRLTPPDGNRPVRQFVGWLEDLIGSDPDSQDDLYPEAEEPNALRIVARARDLNDEAVSERDVAALQSLKDVLRGLVWAEEALDTPPVDFPRFFQELEAAVGTVNYQLPLHPERQEILAADVVRARGISVQAAALLGLAESEFPATLHEDPFLRDSDRARMRTGYGLDLESSTESAELEYFYEAVTRPRQRLLLTRPRLAENGADWQQSPFWDELKKLVKATTRKLTSESVPGPEEIASWPELMESLAVHPECDALEQWVAQEKSDRLSALKQGSGLVRIRRQGSQPVDGDLKHLAAAFEQKFGPGHIWSCSRLEAYRSCPFFFFVGSILRLEAKAEPAEGLDIAQLGSIYHNILEHLYKSVDDPGNLDELLAALPAVAEKILDEAPQQEGFRVTAWWQQTRATILKTLKETVQALAEVQADFKPSHFELRFGLSGCPPLVVQDADDRFQLRGLIDRIDCRADGRLRVIDYKSGGPSSYSKKAIVDGDKLQLPLYALAARDALGLGQPVEGFYWHIKQAVTSGFTLSKFDDGPAGAMKVAVENAWEAVRGARGGQFAPEPPQNGCPSYCPAAAFCWYYRPGFGA